ncbi:hypothetical protein [Herbidospora sp. RD11066]
MSTNALAGHAEPHPLAGSTIYLKSGSKFVVEDWWDRLAEPWQASGAPVAVAYKVRAEAAGLPLDNEVIYGKIGNGLLIHETEIDWKRGVVDEAGEQ